MAKSRGKKFFLLNKKSRDRWGKSLNEGARIATPLLVKWGKKRGVRSVIIPLREISP